MGLDGVELVMMIENEFRILMDKEDVGHIVTVGQLVEVVERKLSPEGRRQVGVGFYRARQVIADSVLIDKRVIRPHTDLRPLIPASQVSGVWADLREAGFHLPGLSLSKLGVAVFLAAWITMTAVAVKGVLAASGWGCFGALVGYAMIFFGWMPSLWLVYAVSRPGLVPSLRSIPASYSTAGALARRWSESSAATHRSEEDSDKSDRDVEVAFEFGSAVVDDPDLCEKALDQLKGIIRETCGDECFEERTFRLSEIIPRRARWVLWGALEQRGAPILPLRLNNWVRSCIALPLFLVGLALVVGSLWAMLLLLDAGWFGTAALTAIVGLTVAVFLASIAHGGLTAYGRAHHIWWLVSDFPKEWETLGSAAQWLSDHSWPFVAPEVHVRSRNIARRVREIIAELSGVQLEKVHLESRLADLLQ